MLDVSDLFFSLLFGDGGKGGGVRGGGGRAFLLRKRGGLSAELGGCTAPGGYLPEGPKQINT